MAKLTKRTIDGLRPKPKDYLVFDDEMPRFGVRVMCSGVKSYLIQYRRGGHQAAHVRQVWYRHR